MKEKNLICNVCNKQVPEKVDCWSTWFGRYQNEELKSVICKDCIKENREDWRKGKI
jgi:hypothetical protein